MPYIEGDDLHPQSNIKKMSSGVPLNDQDREPWLELIRKRAEELAFEDRSTGEGRTSEKNNEDKVQGVVAGCSALKKYYREILRGRLNPATIKANTVPEHDYHTAPPSPATPPTYFVFIDGPKEVLYDRMSKRPGHFFKASMLDSQLVTLEDPTGEEGVVVVSLESTTEEQISLAKLELGKLVGRDL
jgi:gluconokinase